MNLLDIAKAKAMFGSSGGGGGSSDFSTANVTLVPSPNDEFLGASASAYIEYLLDGENGYSAQGFRIIANGNADIILYQGEATFVIETVFVDGGEPAISPRFTVVSGDAIQDEEYPDNFYISGDCVIRVSTK